MARQRVHALDHVEQQPQLTAQRSTLTRAGAQVAAGQLGQVLDRGADVAGAHVREGLGDVVHLNGGQPHGLADLANGHAGLEGLHHAHAGDAVLAVAVEQITVDVGAP